MWGAPTPVNRKGFSIAAISSCDRNGFSDESVVIRATPWPRPFMPIAEVIPLPDMTRVPSSKTKQGISISPMANKPLCAERPNPLSV